MPTDSPIQSGGRQRSDLSRKAAAASAEWCDVDSINSVAHALPPEEGRSRGHCPSLLHSEAQVRIKSQGIGCADQADGVRVRCSWKEWVECLQTVVIRIPVATCRVSAQAQPGFEWNAAYGLA